MKLSWTYKASRWIAVATVAIALASCGKAKFQKQNFQDTAAANNQTTKPKIDIVLFQDNSASMITPIFYLKNQLENFLGSIHSQWDFHFTVLPLQSTMPLTSKYIVAGDCSTISSGNCLSKDQSSYFNSASGDIGWIRTINTSTTNLDLGFQTIQANLTQSSMYSSGFLRSDAALAVVVVSNGEDTTGLTSADYINVPGQGTQINWNAVSLTNSYNSFYSFISTLKGVPQLAKFYSVVNLPPSISPGSNYCYGELSFVGVRYSKMSTQFGSESYNVCDNGVSYVMDRIYSQLTGMIQQILFNYAVIAEEPLASSIVVKKNGVTLANSSTNGWTYEGFKSNSPTSYFPTSGNNQTGYFIKLHGTATYKGSDVISVDYQKL